MFLTFDNIDCAINETGILAYSASLDTSNSIDGAYVLGYQGIVKQLPFGPVKSTFQATYSPEIGNEPNFSNLNKIKSFISESGYAGERFELAGIVSFNSYLDSYSIKIQPNNLVQSSISYSSFVDLQGQLRPKSNLINYLQDGSLSHAWTVYIFNTGDYTKQPIYDFNYDAKINWQPVYIIGNKYPADVKLLNIVENITLTTDIYRQILFTGESPHNNLLIGSDGNIKFENLSLICSDNCSSAGLNPSQLNIDLHGFKIKSNSIISQTREFVRVSYQLQKFY